MNHFFTYSYLILTYKMKKNICIHQYYHEHKMNKCMEINAEQNHVVFWVVEF